MKPAIVITCEHGGNRVPEQLISIFKAVPDILNTHEAWDIGAIEIANQLAQLFNVKLFFNETSRLIIDLNRSVDNEEIFSRFTRKLTLDIKNQLFNQYYYPYRKQVERHISKLRSKSVFHFSVHTFTPVLNGMERQVDIGILFDEDRAMESSLGHCLKNILQSLLPELVILSNVPYQGIDDGFTTSLRKLYVSKEYCGVELEINQKWVETPEMERIITALFNSITECIKKRGEDNQELLQSALSF